MVLRLHEIKCSSVPRTAISTASVARSVHQQLALNEFLHASHAHIMQTTIPPQTAKTQSVSLKRARHHTRVDQVPIAWNRICPAREFSAIEEPNPADQEA